MPSSRKPKHRHSAASIALGGILMGLSWIFLALSATSPTAKLFLQLLASLVVACAYLELKLSGAILVALGSSFLGFIYPGLMYTFTYAVLFSPLPVLILYLSHSKLPVLLQYLITHVSMTTLFLLILRCFGLNNFIGERLSVISSWLIWLILIIGFQLLLFIARRVYVCFEELYSRKVRQYRHKKR